MEIWSSNWPKSSLCTVIIYLFCCLNSCRVWLWLYSYEPDEIWWSFQDLFLLSPCFLFIPISIRCSAAVTGRLDFIIYLSQHKSLGRRVTKILFNVVLASRDWRRGVVWASALFCQKISSTVFGMSFYLSLFLICSQALPLFFSSFPLSMIIFLCHPKTITCCLLLVHSEIR